MDGVLRYGADSSVRLKVSDGALLTRCCPPRGVPLEDPGAEVARALAQPLGYPPLVRSTTPGDRVVLTLGPDVPRVAEIVAAVVRCLVYSGVDPDGVAVLQAGAAANDPCRLIPDELGRRITLITHDPTRREELAYLAATRSGEPILLNRAIHDADLVLPIGCLQGRTTAGYHGVCGSFYPVFSDQRTALRYRRPVSLDARGGKSRRLLEEVNEVGWLLGIALTIQVVPGAGDGILHVLAGEVHSVDDRGRRLYDEAWGCSVPRRASLVVAAIEGGCAQQTWQNFGRALAAAEVLTEDGGAIAVCCDLAAPLGPALQRLAGARSRREALARIDKDRPEDALPAAQLVRALDRGAVYLLSRLDESTVEELDVTHIAEARELARLVQSHDSCILLANAPNAVVELGER